MGPPVIRMPGKPSFSPCTNRRHSCGYPQRGCAAPGHGQHGVDPRYPQSRRHGTRVAQSNHHLEDLPASPWLSTAVPKHPSVSDASSFLYTGNPLVTHWAEYPFTSNSFGVGRYCFAYFFDYPTLCSIPTRSTHKTTGCQQAASFRQNHPILNRQISSRMAPETARITPRTCR